MNISRQIFNDYQKKCPFLHDEDLDLIKEITKYKSYKKGDVIFDLDELHKNAYLIVRGLVKVYYFDNEGNEVVLEFHQENELLANFHSLVNKPSTLRVEAIEDTHVVSVNVHEVEDIVKDNVALLRCYNLILKERLVRAHQTIRMRMNEKPEERYRQIVSHRSHLFNRVSKKEIASYLGITPGSLSRMRKRIGD